MCEVVCVHVWGGVCMCEVGMCACSFYCVLGGLNQDSFLHVICYPTNELNT